MRLVANACAEPPHVARLLTAGARIMAAGDKLYEGITKEEKKKKDKKR